MNLQSDQSLLLIVRNSLDIFQKIFLRFCYVVILGVFIRVNHLNGGFCGFYRYYLVLFYLNRLFSLPLVRKKVVFGVMAFIV